MDDNARDGAVTVRVTLSADNYCDMQRQYTKPTITALTVFFTIFVPLAGFRVAGIPLDVLSALTMAGMALAICLFMLLALPRILRAQWVKQYRAHKLLHGEQTYIIAPDGLERSGDNDAARFKWSDLNSFTEIKDGFCVFVSDQMLYYIPKTCFEGGESDIALARGYFSALPPHKNAAYMAWLRPLLLLAILFVLIFALTWLL